MIDQPRCPVGDVKSWFTKASETEAASVRAIETEMLEKALESWGGGLRFICAYCSRMGMDHKEAIVSHIGEW